MKKLIEKGASVNASSKSSQTPLLIAVSYGHLDCVKLLLENGADINAK